MAKKFTPHEALEIAIQMEMDGKKFYLKASQESSNELGKQLLQTLAKEEDSHRVRFEKIYEQVREQDEFPEVDFRPDNGQALRTVFSEAGNGLAEHSTPLGSELDAVQTAMEMENKTRDFYLDRAENAISEAEKKFYTAVASEETEHHLVLLDYYEYLKDPAGYFTGKEHPSLDGG